MKGKKAHSSEQGDNTSDCNESFDNDSSNDSIVEKDRNPKTRHSSGERMDNFDDFLTAAQETNTFEKAKQDAPSYDNDRLDKSIGWATQK
jgi:hypothetical protein